MPPSVGYFIANKTFTVPAVQQGLSDVGPFIPSICTHVHMFRGETHQFSLMHPFTSNIRSHIILTISNR